MAGTEGEDNAVDHSTILTATRTIPDDEARGVKAHLERLDALIAELQTMETKTPEAGDKLHWAHEFAWNLYAGARLHPCGGRPDVWHLSMLKTLNEIAARLQLDQAPMPFHLDPR